MSANYEKSLLFTPEGVKDIYGKDCEERIKIKNDIHETMKLYGFKDIETPTYEFFDIFGEERGTVKSQEMFKFFDQYNNTLVLRPDITPSIARCVSKYYKSEEMQLRFCYMGNTFLHRRGYQGKLSEITQIGAELMNDDSSDADGEMITMTVDCLKSTGLNDFKVDIGHAGLIKGLIKEARLEEKEANHLKVLLANKNSFAVSEMLEKKDIPDGCKELLIKLPELFGDIETINFAKEKTNNSEALEALDRLEKIYMILESLDMLEYATFDLGMLSNYDYYTGVIFKAYTYGAGTPIVSGGRYDNLLSQFGKNAPAIGLAVVLDELINALNSQQVHIDICEKDILILYRSANRISAITKASELRLEGKSVRLMRKDAQTSLDVYKEYGKNNEVSHILYIDDTGLVSKIEIL